MRRWSSLIVGVISLLLISTSSMALYGKRYCGQPWVTCIHIKSHQSWESLWPDPYQRDVVKRLNRMNTPLFSGLTIAVPKDPSLTVNDIAPFAQHMDPTGTRTVIVSPVILAWGAYDENGQLVKWGPVSAGKDYCPDVGRFCHSVTGVYDVYEKRGADCISTKFPVDEGGAPMPYCMFYSGGFALHGSPEVPGYLDSHGCVRLFIEDARWLNQEFVNMGETKIIVLPYQTAPRTSSS